MGILVLKEGLMILAEKLYTLRKKSGLSQEQLAEQLNVSRQAISKWESGQSVPESDKLIAISKYFNVTLDYLMKEDDGQQLTYPKAEETNSFQTNDKTKWLLGMVSCIGGIICLIMWGILSMLNPRVSDQLSESSTIHIDGNGIFLILCIIAIILGAVLLLKGTKKK